MTSQDKYLAFEKLMRRLAQSSSAAIAYGAAILTTIALMPGLDLPPVFAGLAGGVGANILSSIIERIADGEEISNDELFKKLEEATDDLKKVLSKDEFFTAYSHLLDKFRDSHNEHKIIIQKIESIVKAINPDIELTPEQEAQYLDMYLQGVKRITKRLPWGYALSSLSPDLEISQVYVPPTFVHQERQRAIQVIMDEKQERDQERREKKMNFQNASTIRPALVDIYQLLREKNPVSIIGYMGTGKSLTANYVAWLLAKKDELKAMGFFQPKTPILIRLGDQEVLESSVFSSSIFDIATKNFSSTERLHIMQVLKKEWSKGNIVLILDALDEFSGNLDRVKNEIEYLGEISTPGNHIILTSRPSTYRLIKPAGFKVYELNEIEGSNFDRYIRKWVGALLPISDKSDTLAEEHISFLEDQISSHPLVEDLVSNPLLLTILVSLSLTREGIDLATVENETDLYKQYISYIIGRERLKPSSKSSLIPGELLLQVVYGYVGLLVHIARTKPTPQFPDYQYLVENISATRYFSKEPNAITLVEACLDFWEKAGLFANRETMNRKIEFRHQAFQLFGAALGLSYLTPEKRDSKLNTVGNDPQWFDVLRLFLGIKPTSISSDFKLE
jgi:hypothetical protein